MGIEEEYDETELQEAEQMALKRAASKFLNWDDPKEHSFNPIHKRPPLDLSDCKPLKVKWSPDREQKRAAIGYTIVLLIVVGLLVILLKASHETCVLEGSDGACIDN
jgi:hypothetical protein